MKHLKTFESYKRINLAEEIAKDILPEIKKIKDDRGIFTVTMFYEFMSERKADKQLIDEVMAHLVDMGFDFDRDSDEDDNDDGFEGYPGIKYSLN